MAICEVKTNLIKGSQNGNGQISPLYPLPEGVKYGKEEEIRQGRTKGMESKVLYAKRPLRCRPRPCVSYRIRMIFPKQFSR